ncbi:MAG: bifunctional sugar-1-phosphate nucleotidylyltransferase/acetyltransferase [Promethearchaeota archaeon]
MITKAVLLVAGEGKRLDPITATRPKHMIPLGGTPLLEHTLKSLKEIGIREVLLVVGYLQEVIREYFSDGGFLGLSVEYIEQEEYLGTANATELGRGFTGADPFVMMYGDLLVDPGVLRNFSEYAQNHPRADAIISLRRVPDPSKYGIISLGGGDRVQKIVEKPSPGLDVGNLANAGIYVLRESIYGAIESTELSPRGEYELTDSLQVLVDGGKEVLGFDIGDEYWSDVGHPWQLLDANNYIMDHFLENGVDGDVEDNVTIRGNLHVGEGTVIKAGTYIEGPVFIGRDCSIGPNAYIRPFSSIGNGCRVGNSSEIKASIILDGSLVPHLSYVGDSIVGSGVNLAAGTTTANVRLDKGNIWMSIKGKRTDTGRRKLGAVIGDGVQTGIHVNFMPGVKVGPRAFIGANTVVDRDVPPDSLFYATQNVVEKCRKK